MFGDGKGRGVGFYPFSQDKVMCNGGKGKKKRRQRTCPFDTSIRR